LELSVQIKETALASNADRTYNILVYGIEKKGLAAPRDEISGHSYVGT